MGVWPVLFQVIGQSEVVPGIAMQAANGNIKRVWQTIRLGFVFRTLDQRCRSLKIMDRTVEFANRYVAVPP